MRCLKTLTEVVKGQSWDSASPVPLQTPNRMHIAEVESVLVQVGVPICASSLATATEITEDK